MLLAQSEQTAELEKKLPSLKGSERVDTLNYISYLLRRTSYEKSLIYAKEAFTLSKEINYKMGEANALYNFGFAEYTQNNLEKAEDYYKKALSIFRERNDEKEIAKILNTSPINARKIISRSVIRLKKIFKGGTRE